MKFAEERELFAAVNMHREYSPPPTVNRPGILDYVHLMADNRRMISRIVALALLLGGLAALAIRPVYEANLLIQIADSAGPVKNFFGDAANVFDIKTPATAEMEIMRSRMVVGPAAEKNQLLIVAEPRYMPIAGRWLARHLETASRNRLLNFAGWAQGADGISVRQFDVPEAWEGRTFTIRVEADGRFTLRHPSMAAPVPGKVGELIESSLGRGRLTLLVAFLQGDQGAEFTVVKKPRGEAIEHLQDALKLVERGRQSGIIEATLRDTDATRAASVLNAIGANYVNQNLDRKSAEAEKSIAFLDAQLPALKRQLDRAEDAYNAFRSRKGTVSLPDEAKLVLERSSGLRGKLAEAQQKKRDLLTNFGAAHPAVRTVDEQISGLQLEIGELQSKVSQLPATQQDALRLERDVKVSNDLYQQQRNNVLQLQLVREGRSGNARIIDSAVPPYEPIRPKPAIVLGVALLAGILIAFMVVLVRSGLARGVKNTREIETLTGLNVYAAAIPISKTKGKIGASGISQKAFALSALSNETTVALRQLKTVLQHQMRDRKNNRVLITGPSKGVGVHFIGVNLAAVFATGGTRVLLVDTDLKRDSFNQYFGMNNDPGVAELIAGTCTSKQVTKATGIPHLDFIPAGSAPLNSSGLATSLIFLQLLDQVSKEYDMVMLMAPPILHSAETLSMISSAATVLVVARAGKTPVDDVIESARRLSQAGQIPSGVILNGV